MHRLRCIFTVINLQLQCFAIYHLRSYIILYIKYILYTQFCTHVVNSPIFEGLQAFRATSVLVNI